MIKQRSILLLLIALGSGLLMGLTPAPVNAWVLAWVALVPLWVLVLHSAIRQTTDPPRWLIGLVWGIGYHGSALFWITGVHPMTWMGVPWLASLAIAVFCWLTVTLVGALLVMSWVVGVTRLESFRKSVDAGHWALSSALTRVLVGTALWCGLEQLWSYGSLYWTSLSYTQSPFNLVILHLGQLSGPLTVTAVIVAFNGLLAEALVSMRSLRSIQTRQLLLAAIGLIVAAHAVGGWLYLRPLNDVSAMALRVGIIQGNIPNTIKLYEEGWRRALKGYTTGYQTLADEGVDAVLTPETALPILWTSEQKTRSSFYQAVVQNGVPVWLGSFGGNWNRMTNSLFMVDGDGTTRLSYDKVKLVPLGEYIPFEQFMGRFIDRLSPLDAHLVRGNAKQLFDTLFGRAIAAICYESAFPEVFRYQAAAGGQFILTASNNAHYSKTMPAQHHAQDVMRAVETDRWAVRATNTGYSGIVDPHGRTIWISGINTYELHADTVFRRQTRTLYVRWGNVLTPMLLLSAIALVLRDRLMRSVG